ncbi:hypothetical protein LOD99_10924 [Oopsacas minuta]|uniref:Uncharacterized protein n=1 Tax=Oopsacas minuta TaxID=111878 RepID=A0AAV7KDD2_9METZ|nr:hypothetical protein LOD99_10924 [Oopsacas minuta]
MLSSHHTKIGISHLNKWLYTTKKVLNKVFSPAHIEIDFSWAMLHSICYSFKQESLEIYLSNCWQMNTTQDIVFISLSISCSRNRYPEVEKYIAMLQRIITCDQEQVDLEIDYLAELDEELPNDLGDSITYKSSSPYGRHIESVLKVESASNFRLIIDDTTM